MKDILKIIEKRIKEVESNLLINEQGIILDDERKGYHIFNKAINSQVLVYLSGIMKELEDLGYNNHKGKKEEEH